MTCAQCGVATRELSESEHGPLCGDRQPACPTVIRNDVADEHPNPLHPN